MCPARQACAGSGIGERFGTFGGLSERERRTLPSALTDRFGVQWLHDAASGDVIVVEGDLVPRLTTGEARALLETLQPVAATTAAVA